jgi:hypothetical protein
MVDPLVSNRVLQDRVSGLDKAFVGLPSFHGIAWKIREDVCPCPKV